MNLDKYIAKDKLIHLAGTALAAVCIVLLCFIGQVIGVWWAAGIGGTAGAWGFERLQKYRGEGDPSKADAWYGTAGAWIAALAVYLLLHAG